MYPKDSVLGGEIFDLQQQFLIHQTRHVCQKSGQLVTGVHPTCIFSGLGFCTSFEYFDLTAKNQYLLRGLIKCGLCGRTYIGVAANRPNGKREFYYRCNGAHSPAVFSPKGKCCSKAIRGDELEQQVWIDVETFLRNPDPVLSELQSRLGSQGKDRIRSEYNSPALENVVPLPPDHGAPLRLRNETQLGFKQVKWIKGLEFVADIGGGHGGYHQDHEFFGYRQSI